ncbi:hypothetical protein [Kitasatospora sp. McL0602]
MKSVERQGRWARLRGWSRVNGWQLTGVLLTVAGLVIEAVK